LRSIFAQFSFEIYRFGSSPSFIFFSFLSQHTHTHSLSHSHSHILSLQHTHSHQVIIHGDITFLLSSREKKIVDLCSKKQHIPIVQLLTYKPSLSCVDIGVVQSAKTPKYATSLGTANNPFCFCTLQGAKASKATLVVAGLLALPICLCKLCFIAFI